MAMRWTGLFKTEQQKQQAAAAAAAAVSSSRSRCKSEKPGGQTRGGGRAWVVYSRAGIVRVVLRDGDDGVADEHADDAAEEEVEPSAPSQSRAAGVLG